MEALTRWASESIELANRVTASRAPSPPQPAMWGNGLAGDVEAEVAEDDKGGGVDYDFVRPGVVVVVAPRAWMVSWTKVRSRALGASRLCRRRSSCFSRRQPSAPPAIDSTETL
jgi:hypothetical protein